MSQVAACILAVAGTAYGQLTLSGVRCGQLTCALGEFCSPNTDRCAPCSDVCNKTHHNYDEGLCVKECQSYIHDLRYMGKTADVSTPPDFKTVQNQARVAMIISILVLALLVLTILLKCISLFRDHRGKFTWRQVRQKFQISKNQVKQYPNDYTQRNPHAEMATVKPELKINIPNANPEPPKRADRTAQPLNVRDLDRKTTTERSQGATTPKTISTSLSNRHPAEDTTLDNPYTYDNMGMNVTPPPVQASASHTNF